MRCVVINCGLIVAEGYVCVIWQVRVNDLPFKDSQTADMKGFSRRLVVLRSTYMRCVVTNRGLIVVEGVCMCNLASKSK